MNEPSDPPRRPALWPACALLVLGGHACGGGGGGSSKVAEHTPGTVVQKPGGGFCFADPNQNGNAQEPRILTQKSGRLVDVFGLDASGVRVPMAETFVIAAGLIGDGQDYMVETNAITAQQSLVVLRDVTDTAPGGGLAQFYQLMYSAGAGLSPIHEASSDDVGVFSMVPRNGAVVVQFDDLIDARTLTNITFRIHAGNPPVIPFEGRVFMDPNFGDLADHDSDEGSEFYSTRIIFDSTVTEIESFQHEPPLPVNGVGLPASLDVSLANVEIRIPTVLLPEVGQNRLLANPSGHPITSKNNGPVDFGSPTVDVVRAARSGGTEELTGDPFNGFLPDTEAPLLVGTQGMVISQTPESVNGADVFVLPKLQFRAEFCSQTPEVGDIIAQPGIFAEVLQKPVPVQNGLLRDVRVRLLLYPPSWDDEGQDGPLEWLTSAPGDADFLAAFDVLDDLDRQACFATIFPTPGGFPEHPTEGLATSSTMSLRFSEPMDPTSLTAFDSMTVTRQPVPDEGEPPLSTSEYIVGTVVQALDLQEFTFVPDLPFAHISGFTEDYFLTVTDGARGPTDLAGNTLSDALPSVEMLIDPGAGSQRNGGRVSRFTGQDEEPPIGEDFPLPEWGGQHLYDLGRQLILPRPVVHFQTTCDRGQPLPKLMTPFPLGVQTPLSNFGSRMQLLWRYCDFSFSLAEFSNHNIDIEGAYWSPLAGAVVADSFEEFEILIGHSDSAPDEYIAPGSLFPKFGQSGLSIFYDKNFLSQDLDPPRVVHPKFRGYQVNPGDLFVHPQTGTKLLPWPWNQNVSPEDWVTYTWRDTALRDRAGSAVGGADPLQLWKALGITPPINYYYRDGNVRTVGLAVMLDFKCFPDEGASGVNSLDISLAANSTPQPFFRAFSTGGINPSGNVVLINPELETKANGGFNPLSNPPGQKTIGLDNSYYPGAANFVARVSRSHSVWFPATNPFNGFPFSAPVYVQPRMEPRIENQPDGTSVVLAFRGMQKSNPIQSDSCGEFNEDWLSDASTLDSYGDHYDDKCIDPDGVPKHNKQQENEGIKFFNGSNWHDSISAIDGAKYYQVRVTFEANIFTGLVPELSALAVSWLAP